MAMAKYFLAAFYFANSVISQQCSGTLTITASADASALASCTTYSGSVVIPTGLAVPKDANGRQTLVIETIQKITGNFTVTNIDPLTSISCNSLKSVGGMEFGSLTQLTAMSFQQLTTVDQLNMTALPQLQTMDFGDTGVTQAKSILITNTGLTSLNGINNLKSVEVFNVNNNQALTNISLQVTSIENSLDIEANDGFISGLSTSFPLLEFAQNMTFRNCSEILLPALKNVTDDLGFYGNGFKTFVAPKLTTAGGIVFVDNTDLTNISMPMLTSINGTFSINNNTKLPSISGFDQLTVVTGAIDFSGNFTEADLPDLTQVQGAFSIATSGDFDCTKFQEAKTNKVIRGPYACAGSQTKPESGGASSTATGTGSTSSKTAAAAPLNVNLPFIMGGSTFIAGVLHILI